jgi:TonB family protein
MDRVDPDGHSHIQPVTVSMTGGDWGQYVDCLNAQFRAHPYREWVQRNIVASSEDKGKPTAPGDATKTPAQTQLAQPQVSVARPPASILPQPGGEPIPLDTAEPKYQDYFNKVRERIKAKWVYPLPAGERGIEGELLIEFHIAKDGRLEFIELRRSSGTQILDDAALTAVRQAQPFAPVPDDVAKRSLVINGSFRYTITRP